MTDLTTPLTLRHIQIPGRLWMSPMCMYSADADGAHQGQPTEWHRSHYAARAAGGCALVMVEATAVSPGGRISPQDLGLWSDDQIPAFTALASAIRAHGAVPGIQLAHAGRKASSSAPFRGGAALGVDEGGWEILGASPLAFPGFPEPRALSIEGIAEIVEAFAQAARRARECGFEVVEIHAAHGYLLSSFLSPFSNVREDEFGGDLTGRCRLLCDVVSAVRSQMDENHPLFVRLSVTDWREEAAEPGWRFADTVTLSRELATCGVDLIDCSSGGNIVTPIPKDRDYQIRWATKLKAQTGIAVAGVGRVNEFDWAGELIAQEAVDALFVGKALLTDPSFVNHTATHLGLPGRYLPQYAYTVRRS